VEKLHPIGAGAITEAEAIQEPEDPSTGTGKSHILPVPLSENTWRALILGSAAAVTFLSFYCLSRGITIVFMHLYYFPIVLLAYHYRRKGVYLETLLGLSYVGLVAHFFPANPTMILEAAIRFFVFLGIAALVAYLSERLVRIRDETKRVTDIQESSLMNANVLLMLLDSRGRIQIWNNAAERITGYTAAEVIGRNDIWKLLYPEKEYRDRITGKITKIIGENNFFENLETTIQCRNGDRKIISWNTRMIPGDGDKDERFIAIGVDVTESRRAEDALKESEEKFRVIFDHASDGMFLVDLDTRKFFSCNNACAKMLGYDQGRFPNLDVADIHPREDLPFIYEQIGKYSRGEEGIRNDGRFRRRDGSIFYADISFALVIIAGKRYLLITFKDITERKRAEEVIRESEERYRTLAEASPDQIFIVGRDDTIKYVNTAALKLFRRSYDQVIGTPRKNLFPSDIADAQGILLKNIFKTGEHVQTEEKIHFGTQELWIDTSLVPLKDETGNVTAILGVARDITERRATEKALTESEQKFRTLFDSSPDGLLLADSETRRFVMANAAIMKQTGYTKAELFSFSVTDLVPPAARPAAIEQFKKQVRGETALSSDIVIQRKDGTAYLADISSTPITMQGRQYQLGIFRDITDRKRAEEEIAHLASFPELNPNPVLELNPAGDILYVNPAVTESLLLAGVPDDPHLFLPHDLLAILPGVLKGETDAIEREVQVGKRIFLENISNTPQIGTVRIYTRDITIRKQTETALRESEEMFRNPVEHSSVGIFLVQDGVVHYANSKLAEIAGYPREELLNRAFESLILAEDLPMVKDALGRMLRGDMPAEHLEYRAVRKDGTIIDAEAYGSSMIFHGRPAVYATIIDVTERKKMADQIAESLREKEVMLREIHHRVKNNLQIVNSLMNLQIQKVGDPKTIMALTDTQTRVRAMSLVHERLYKTQELSRIDFADYISKLTEELLRSQKISQKVELDLDIHGIFLDINLAVPVGLILNEIITNSLKYAFPDGRQGKISISAEKSGEAYSIRIADNGVGIPETFDWQKSNTLGMRLIHGLVSQVDGTITLDRAGGTGYTIRIPDTKNTVEEEKKKN
jgi:PAS domain S-box-containing protein